LINVICSVLGVGVIILFTPILIFAYITTTIEQWMNNKEEGYDNE
jgi:hypothetical protein